MKMSTRAGALLLLVLVSVAACEARSKIDKALVERNLLTAAPTPQHPVNADLGGKVVYLGNDLDRTALKPGEPFTVVHYWKVVEAPGPDWRIFTHVDGSTSRDWMNADASPMRQSHGPERWTTGQIVRDEQTITLEPDWSSPFATINLGLYRKGATSEKDRMPVVSGPHDERQRVTAIKLPVVGAKSPSPPPRYVIRRASGPITVDGKADEAAWAQAPSTSSFQETEGGPRIEGTTTAKLLWDDQNLYVLAEIADRDVHSSYVKHDDPLWKEDVIEAFIDADGNRRAYVELQVNPNGTIFDSWFRGTRQDGGDPSWQSGMTAAVTVNGTRDDRDDTDRSWTAEMSIPLAAVKGKDDSMAVVLPPRPGDRWRLNLVRVEGGKGALAWSRIPISDFHALTRLGEAVFADAQGQTGVAPASPEPAAKSIPTSP